MTMTMSPISPPRNYSIFTLPVYFFLALAPHLYSKSLLKTPGAADPSAKSKDIYNLANPRSTANGTKYSAALPPATYARYERARAAHTNMMENAAFVVAAVLAGAVARLDAGYMNWMCGVYVASRVGYTVTYVSVERGPWAVLRTVWYTIGVAVLVGIWWEAGKVVLRGEY